MLFYLLKGLMVMLLLILCVEVPQSQGGFELQSSTFRHNLCRYCWSGAYLKSRILDIRYHQTSHQGLRKGQCSIWFHFCCPTQSWSHPLIYAYFWALTGLKHAFITTLCHLRIEHSGFTNKLHQWCKIGLVGMFILIFSQKSRNLLPENKLRFDAI